MTDPMKSEAPDPFLQPRVRPRINIGRGIERRVEGRVKDGNFGDAIAKKSLRFFDHL